MLRSLKTLESYAIAATDGDIGSVSDFYFDDERWTVRYLVADTAGFWEGPRQVLISPVAFRQADWSTRRFHLALTQEKVKGSPSADLDLPVSRQYERNYFRYYNWHPYWGYGGIWGDRAHPEALARIAWSELREQLPADDPHLRSAREIENYNIQGTDDQIGHVKDFIVDDESWTIRYLVIDTSNWWVGKTVLLAPHWIDRISWGEKKVHINMGRETIKNCPEWSPGQPINRAFEMRLYDYYARPAYWEEDASATKARLTKS